MSGGPRYRSVTQGATGRDCTAAWVDTAQLLERFVMRVKSLLVPAAVTLFAIGGAATTAAVADPGPNGHNNFGLCTAYFAGSEKGQEMKHKAPPFVALEEAASAANQSVEEWCAENGQQPGNGGGRG